VDIFVCTADLRSEPPSLVVSAVLSVMAYSYPADKLSVYLSDDGCSALTFYAVWEASRFAKLWLPFCRRHSIEPRSPAAYFSETDDKLRAGALCSAEEWSLVKVNTVLLQYCNTVLGLGPACSSSQQQAVKQRLADAVNDAVVQ